MKSTPILISIVAFQISGILFLGFWDYNLSDYESPRSMSTMTTHNGQGHFLGKPTTGRLPVTHVWRDSKDVYEKKAKALLDRLHKDDSFASMSEEERKLMLAKLFLTDIADDDFRLMPEEAQKSIQQYIMMHAFQ